MQAVLVLNADLGPLHQVSLRHAIRMLFRQVAVVHEAEPDRLISAYRTPIEAGMRMRVEANVPTWASLARR